MAGLEYRKDWDVLASYFAFKELASAPATPEANTIRLYAKESGGISTLCYKNDAGTEVCFPTTGPFVTGSGTANRMTYWSGASTIAALDALTTGRVPFADANGLLDDASTLFWDNSNAILGVGSSASIHGSTSTTRMSIERDATNILEINSHVAGGTTFAGIDFYKSLGSHAVPSVLGNNDFVGSIRGKAYDGNSYEDVARIVFATGTTGPADGATPGSIYFYTTPPSSVTLAERFRIGQSGEWGIGGANFGTSGQYKRSGGSGAPPTWATIAITELATFSSANLAAQLTDETGSGLAVFATNPTLSGLTMADATNIVLNTTTGTKIGTATTQKLSFYNASPVVQQTDGANLVNNVTAGGTTDQIDNFTDLTVYANDAATIRNDIYQLARKLKIVGDALRVYGLLS